MKKQLFVAAAIIFVLMLIPLRAFATDGVAATVETNTIAQVTQLTDRIIPSGKTPQGGSNYGKYFLQTIGGASYFYLYDLDQNELIATIPFTGDGSSYKNNSACFGTEFYDENDILPLVYVSSAYDYRTVAFRIYLENDTWKVMQVQVINYPTMDNDAGYYSCNVALDNENGYMYLTPLKLVATTINGNQQMFFRYTMPSLEDGPVVELVDSIDAIGSCEDGVTVFKPLYSVVTNAYTYCPQSALVIGGKFYQIHGNTSSHAVISIYDFESETYETPYILFDRGYKLNDLHNEPESLGYYNGSFYSFDVYGKLYKIDLINENIQIQAGEHERKISVKLTNWERGTFNLSTGAESSSTKVLRTPNYISTLGADKLVISPPEHYSSDVSAGTFYKWAIMWYSGTNRIGTSSVGADPVFLGIGSEQYNFSTHREFDVPDGADGFRIAVASIYRGKTEVLSAADFVELDIALYSQWGEEDSLVVLDSSQTVEVGGITKADGTFYYVAKIVRSANDISVVGYDKVVVQAPLHYTGVTTENSYYKWLIHWYDASGNRIGLAPEQEDYCTVTEFTVPATATCFRFCIASVNEGVTDQTFPLETFFEDGGITLQLCQAS